MATVRTARLVERELIRDGALLRFEVSDGAPLGFRGGQYAIVDTGLPLPSGKARKRAYSFSSSDAEQMRFELGVYGLESGLGAAYMLGLEPGAELRFSGPWGKLVAPEPEATGPVWVVATDTGITAALGLVRGAAFAPALARTQLVWWVASHDYFLSRAAIEARLPPELLLHETRSPQVGSPERPLAFSAQLDTLLARDGAPAAIYVTGDGAAPAWTRAWLESQGLEGVTVQSENFFHHPVRKADLR